MDQVDKTYDSDEKSRFYDDLARQYFHRDRLAEFIATKIKSLFPEGNPYICERAAGSGIITETLFKHQLTNIRATDLSPSQLKVLAEKLQGLETAVENLNDPMPEVPENTFDVVFQVGATRFMSKEGQENYINEAARTLKPGGYLLWPVLWVERPMVWFRKGSNNPLTTSWDIAMKMEKQGLEIVEAPWIVHGRMRLLTGTFLIGKKGKPVQRSKGETITHLKKIRKTFRLRER